MQSIQWYIRRLKTMSPSEITWRLQSAGRDLLDRYRIPAGIYPSPREAFKFDPETKSTPPFPLVSIDLQSAKLYKNDWREKLINKADLICQHKFSFFNLTDHFLGDPIDWHKDHGSGVNSSLAYIGKVDYRDFTRNGDCKLVWEASRHHQLVVLGRAYKITGDAKYAQELIDQIVSWLDNNPFGFGMNWRSPLELSIRILNWAWALDLIRESGLFSGDIKRRILHSVYLHLWDVSRKFSQGSSANNHLIGEAAGVFIACCYFPELNNTDKWRSLSRDILIKEIEQQIYADGCNKELAFGYQLFVAQFCLFSGIVARKAGCDFPDDYWQKLEKMLEFTGALIESGNLPNYGDTDDGYVLNLGATHSDAKYLLAAGAVLFKRHDFKMQAGEFPEPVFWLLGPESLEKYKQLKISADDRLVSRAFFDSGFYLLQGGSKTKKDQISILFDCGELGYKSIAAHGHADALSFTLRIDDEDILVDTGTYDYFTYPNYRQYFRKTRAHNTIEIDGKDQSEILGSFMWGERANCKCLQWQPGPGGQGGLISAEHDGYKKLSDPLIHRRTLEMDTTAAKLTIKDEISADAPHLVDIYFHLNHNCSIIKKDNNCYEIITKKKKKVIIELDQQLQVEIFCGAENPLLGWHSTSYHIKQPTNTIKCSAQTKGNGQFLTYIYPNEK